MTAFLRALGAFLSTHVSFNYFYVEHAGPVVHHCGDSGYDDGLDEPAPDTYRIGEDALAALLEDGIAEYANGATREQARQHVMNALVMRGIEIDAEDD